ncbi:MAG: DUF1836 domain-containing protein [Lachnospiraceae bacterium]|nr:DUF1836 domain-containing protein [Lachnospiraceae bacterium]
MKDFTFNEIQEKIEQWMETDVIIPEDIPSIELYMDQVTTFMDKQLSGTKRHENDKILTKTMINNYSKNDLLPPSDKKKYSKDHIILLIYIYYMKNFLSISDIQNLLSPMTEHFFLRDNGITMSDIYSDIFNLEKNYKIKLKENIYEVCKLAEEEFPEDSEYLKTFAMIALLSYDIYTKKQLIERLLDSIADTAPTKAELKEAKELSKQKKKEAKELSKQKEKEDI